MKRLSVIDEFNNEEPLAKKTKSEKLDMYVFFIY